MGAKGIIKNGECTILTRKVDIRTALRHLNKEEFFTLLRLRDMCGDKRVLCTRNGITIVTGAHSTGKRRATHHERLKIGAPPLGEAVTNLPVVVDAMGRVELTRLGRRGQAVI